MKTRLVFLSICIAAMTVNAQTADIEVSYNSRVINSKGNANDKVYHLIANPTQSKYFSPKSEQIDSLTSTPEGAAQFKEMQKAAMQEMMAQGAIIVNKLPRKTEYVYVMKSLPDSTITYYDAIGTDENIYYTEPLSEMVWSIGDNTKNILGYECVEATTDYHGRKWTAWFTPDIPISDGPWKFHGLPGLILEAEEASGAYSFTATGIEKTDKIINPVYGANKYDQTDRLSMLRAKRAIMDNPMGKLTSLGIKAKIDPTSLPKSDRATSDFIETDY